MLWIVLLLIFVFFHSFFHCFRFIELGITIKKWKQQGGTFNGIAKLLFWSFKTHCLQLMCVLIFSIDFLCVPFSELEFSLCTRLVIIIVDPTIWHPIYSFKQKSQLPITLNGNLIYVIFYMNLIKLCAYISNIYTSIVLYCSGDCIPFISFRKKLFLLTIID